MFDVRVKDLLWFCPSVSNVLADAIAVSTAMAVIELVSQLSGKYDCNFYIGCTQYDESKGSMSE